MVIQQTKTYIVVFSTKHGNTSYIFPATDFFDCTEKVKKFLQADGGKEILCTKSIEKQAQETVIIN